jgi:quercetin dioxygenase-like cupin family protein
MKAVVVFALAVAWSGVVFAQDPVKVDSAHYKVVADNASVRVLAISYPPGGKSTMHEHPDSMAIFLADAKVRMAFPDGKTQDEARAKETAMYTPAGKHNPSNTGTGKLEVVLVEFKTAGAGTATLPTSRPDMTMKMLAESPRGIVYRVSTGGSFSESAGTKHDYDQVVIALGPSPIELSLDGKPAKTTWARGDAVFIGRGVPHEAKNPSGKPVDFIIVAIR